MNTRLFRALIDRLPDSWFVAVEPKWVFIVHRGKSGSSSPVECVCGSEADAQAHINAMTPAQQKRRSIVRWPLNG